MKAYQLVAILLMGWLASCHSTVNDVLPVNKMKVVMWDMMKADEWYARIKVKDSTAARRKENIRLYGQVFALNHVTREQFYHSYKYYEAHPVQFRTILDSIEACSHREKQQLFSRPPGQAPVH
ncbi:MAG: hypothetical protein NVSMB63_19170 [Sediminibacterium sp.]